MLSRCSFSLLYTSIKALYLLLFIVSLSSSIEKGDFVLVTTSQGQAVAIVKFKYNSSEIEALEQGEIARPNMVLMKTDLYPRRWMKDEQP